MITLFSRKFNLPVMTIYTERPSNQEKFLLNENFLQEPGIGPKLVLNEACLERSRMVSKVDVSSRITNL